MDVLENDGKIGDRRGESVRRGRPKTCPRLGRLWVRSAKKMDETPPLGKEEALGWVNRPKILSFDSEIGLEAV